MKRGLTRTELVRRVADRAGVSHREAKLVVDTVLGSLTDALRNGYRIELRGLGVLHLRRYDGHEGRNPRTGAGVDVPVRARPVFRPSATLVARLAAVEDGE